MKLFRWFKNLFFYWQDDESLLSKYKEIGLEFGWMIEDRFVGEAVGYDQLLDKLIRYEAEVVRRGYRSVPIGLFTRFNGPPKELNVPKKIFGEKKVRYAKEWKDRYTSEDIFQNVFIVLENGETILDESSPDDTNLFSYEGALMKDAALSIGP